MAIDQSEKARRSALVHAHLATENDGSLGGVMETFAPDAVMSYNGIEFPTAEAIAAAHGYLGFAGPGGAFEAPQNVVDRESFTATDVVIEGRLCARHVGEFLGFQATGRHVELPFTAFYCFDHAGKLVNERVVMNLGPLNPDFQKAPPGLL